MSTFDIVMLVIIGGFGLFGFWFGFVHTLGSLLGTVLGAYLASRYYEIFANWINGITGWESNASRVLMFILAFLIINRLVGIGFWVIEHFLKLFTKLPVIKSLNHLFGLFLGLFEGAISIGLIIYFIERIPLGDKIMEYIAISVLVPYLVGMASVLVPVLPEALRMLESSVDYVEGVVVNNL